MSMLTQDIRITSLIHIVILAVMITLAIAGYAQSGVCTVDDENTGYWQRITVPSYNGCVLKGPPTDDSIFPAPDSNSGTEVYIVKGRYKVLLYMSGDGFSWSVPPERDMCADGYAIAYTKWACDNYQKGIEASGIPPYVSIEYTASGTLCTYKHVQNGHTTLNYARFFEATHLYFEWHCNNEELADDPKNIGPPCPPGQCCN